MAKSKADRMRRRLKDSVKKRVRLRDKNRCVRCGLEESLTLHHITPISDFLRGVVTGKANYDDNLVVLCQNCHDKIHRKKGCEKNFFIEYVKRRVLKEQRIKANLEEQRLAQERKKLKQYVNPFKRTNSM